MLGRIGQSDTQPSPAGPRSGGIAHRPNHYWTWRLLADNYDVEQCIEIRGIDEATVLDHLLRAAEDGLEIRAEWFLVPHQLAVLDRMIGSAPPRRLRPLLEELPPDIRSEHLQLYLRCRSR